MKNEEQNLNEAQTGNSIKADVTSSAVKVEQCPEFPYFGAHYPDARCIDGYLHDMDKCDENGNLYVMSESHPCPFCNEAEFMQDQKDNEEDLDKVRQWMKAIKERYS